MSLVKNTGVAENRVCFPSLKRRPEELLARLSYLGELDTGLLHRAHQRGRIIYMFHCLAENIHSCLIWLMTPAQISSWCDRSTVRIIKVLWWSTGPYWIFFKGMNVIIYFWQQKFSTSFCSFYISTNHTQNRCIIKTWLYSLLKMNISVTNWTVTLVVSLLVNLRVTRRAI